MALVAHRGQLLTIIVCGTDQQKLKETLYEYDYNNSTCRRFGMQKATNMSIYCRKFHEAIIEQSVILRLQRSKDKGVTTKV